MAEQPDLIRRRVWFGTPRGGFGGFWGPSEANGGGVAVPGSASCFRQVDLLGWCGALVWRRERGRERETGEGAGGDEKRNDERSG